MDSKRLGRVLYELVVHPGHAPKAYLETRFTVKVLADEIEKSGSKIEAEEFLRIAREGN